MILLPAAGYLDDDRNLRSNNTAIPAAAQRMKTTNGEKSLIFPADGPIGRRQQASDV